jgi:hypothetical protein
LAPAALSRNRPGCKHFSSVKHKARLTTPQWHYIFEHRFPYFLMFWEFLVYI